MNETLKKKWNVKWQSGRSALRTGVLALTVLGMCMVASQNAQADFANGNFETGDFSNWTQELWTNNGTTTASPAKIGDLNLAVKTPAGEMLNAPALPALNEIVTGTEGTLPEPLLNTGAIPAASLLLPIRGTNSARINLVANRYTSINGLKNIIPRTGQVPTNYEASGKTASSITQELTLTAADIDTDGKIHIRFIAAPVLDDPGSSGHTPEQRPYYAISVTKTYDAATSTTLATPSQLFFQYNYANQPGVPWKTFTPDLGGGTAGANAHIEVYTDPQAYDISPGNAFLRVGDKVQIQAVAAGCSPGGHSGQLYLDNFSTHIPAGLWVSASGPVSVSSANGTLITYTYTYTNNGSSPVDNVTVAPTMPVDSVGGSSTFVSLTTNNGGVCTVPVVGATTAASCNFGTLAPGATGTFTMVVTIPNGATGPVNNGNYPITGDGTSILLGPMVQTSLLSAGATSDMSSSSSGMPSSFAIGVPYAGTFTCTNNGLSAAANAICDISGLPTGVTVTGCTVGGTAWLQPAAVPVGGVVSCNVSGTPTAAGASTLSLTTGADNDLNTANNVVMSALAGSAGGVASVPTLSETALAALVALMGWLGVRRMRARASA